MTKPQVELPFQRIDRCNHLGTSFRALATLYVLILVLAARGFAVFTGLPTDAGERLDVGRIARELVGESLADRRHFVDLSGAVGERRIPLLESH